MLSKHHVICVNDKTSDRDRSPAGCVKVAPPVLGGHPTPCLLRLLALQHAEIVPLSRQCFSPFFLGSPGLFRATFAQRRVVYPAMLDWRLIDARSACGVTQEPRRMRELHSSIREDRFHLITEGIPRIVFVGNYLFLGVTWWCDL